MGLIVVIDSYLAKLRALENDKPFEQRRAVPTQTELAETVGMTQSGLSKIFNNRVDAVSRDTLSKILAELRRRGFDTQVSDVLVYVED